MDVKEELSDKQDCVTYPTDCRSWWEKTFGTREVIRWQITPGSLFVSVITVAVAAALLITVGVRIGEQRVIKRPTSPVLPRTDYRSQKRMERLQLQLNQLTQAVSTLASREAPKMQATVVVPKDSIKIVVPPAPKPQVVYVNPPEAPVVPEVKTVEVRSVTDDIEPIVKKKEEVKKVPAYMTKEGDSIPPPKGTEEYDKYERK